MLSPLSLLILHPLAEETVLSTAARWEAMSTEVTLGIIPAPAPIAASSAGPRGTPCSWEALISRFEADLWSGCKPSQALPEPFQLPDGHPRHVRRRVPSVLQTRPASSLGVRVHSLVHVCRLSDAGRTLILTSCHNCEETCAAFAPAERTVP